MRLATAAAAASLAFLTGCGALDAQQQAEELQSLAAEGAILAHDASEGGTTSTFTRIHAGELREAAEGIAQKPKARALGQLGRTIAVQIERLEDDPRDERSAAAVERQLDAAAKRAERLAKSL